MSGKKWNHSIFPSSIAKCWPIFKILSQTDLAVNFQECCYKIPPPHLKHVAALPCEILVSEKQKQPEVYNVIYDISQVVATGFRSGETSDYDFVTNLGLLLSLL